MRVPDIQMRGSSLSVTLRMSLYNTALTTSLDRALSAAQSRPIKLSNSQYLYPVMNAV